MVAVPLAIPVTEPDVPTVAIEVLLLLQAPPVVPSVSVALEPTHTVKVPPMAAGSA
jgi:hypothetical protein